MEKKLIIGITGYDLSEEEGYGGKIRGNVGQGFAMFGHDYLNCVERTGGIPIGLPIIQQNENIEALIDALDALVLTGGEDVDPKLFNQTVDHRMGQICPERDHFELKVIEYALRLHKPILAICRGMQLLNVFLGGTLYRDVSDKGDVLTHNFENNPRWYKSHSVRLTHPLLQELFKQKVMDVNSYHHMAINQLAPSLETAAVAPDGIIEAVVMKTSTNVLGVQWHPEMVAVKYNEGFIAFHWLLEQAAKQSSINNITA